MSTSNKGGCGCGAGCDCCTGMCTDESFKRPNFFAGQLLTEDDLKALMDYVVGKNRLHNRYLFGSGVVCGLSVSCHPCGGGQVMVAPGFALDCCGNDLLVPCREEVDIRELLRDLRKRQLQGFECTDPCEEEGDHRHYGLYLTYSETPGDPVAPYNSGDPCGQQRCEPTRICEGFGFELRCECTTEREMDLYARILACIGDVRSATSTIRRASNLYRAATAPAPAPAGVPSSDIEDARQDAVLLKTWLLTRLEEVGSRTRCDLYDRARSIRLTTDEVGKEPDPDDERRAWLDLVRILLEYFIDCVCLALNPPCGECEDTALLLACVELDGCDVVDICNMSRRFVLSPAAMRYWLPVNLIGNLAKRLCCDLDLSRQFKIDRQEPASVTATDAAAGAVGAGPPPPPPPPPPPAPEAANFAVRGRTGAPFIGDEAKAVLDRIGIRSEGAVDAAEFSASLAGLALRVSNLDTGELRKRAGIVGEDVVTRLRPVAASMIQTPEIRETVNAMVKEEVAAGREAAAAELRDHVDAGRETTVAELREHVDTLAAKQSTDLDKRLSAEVAKVSGDVGLRVGNAVRKEFAVTKLNAAVENLAVVKALRRENEGLKTKLDKLSESVRKLGGNR